MRIVILSVYPTPRLTWILSVGEVSPVSVQLFRAVERAGRFTVSPVSTA